MRLQLQRRVGRVAKSSLWTALSKFSAIGSSDREGCSTVAMS